MSGEIHSGPGYLCGVAVALPSTPRGPITLRLYEPGQDAPIRSTTRLPRPDDGAAWQLFPFEALPNSHDRTYRFSVEPEAGETALAARAIHSPSLSRLFDPWLAQLEQPLPPVPDRLERYLDRHVLECLRMKRHFFLRLAHLADAIGRISERPADVLSIGAGAAFQEAFIAGRFPEIRIDATDVDPAPCNFPIPNLTFSRLDLNEPPRAVQYDLVLSIECLEHIEDPRRAFAHHVAMVRPGGYVYVSVPFATRAEQQDPELRRSAWEMCEHYRPGFAFEDLEELCAENSVDVVHASNMFHVDVIVPARQILDRMSAGELDCGAAAIAQMLLLDLHARRASSCREAEGIRLLGRRR